MAQGEFKIVFIAETQRWASIRSLNLLDFLNILELNRTSEVVALKIINDFDLYIIALHDDWSPRIDVVTYVIELVVLYLQIHQLLLVILDIWVVLQLFERLASLPEQIDILNDVLGNHLCMPLWIFGHLLSSADHSLLDKCLLLLDCKRHWEGDPWRGYRAQICDSEISDLFSLPICAGVRLVYFLRLLSAEKFLVRFTPARLRG